MQHGSGFILVDVQDDLRSEWSPEPELSGGRAVGGSEVVPAVEIARIVQNQPRDEIDGNVGGIRDLQTVRHDGRHAETDLDHIRCGSVSRIQSSRTGDGNALSRVQILDREIRRLDGSHVHRVAELHGRPVCAVEKGVNRLHF